MSAFNTGFLGFASVAANASGAETTLNEVIQLVDALRGPIFIQDVIASSSSEPVPTDDEFGRFWLWNAATGYDGAATHPFAALNQQVGGFQRGALLWFTAGGWQYYDPFASSENRMLFALVLNGVSSLDDNSAHGAATDVSNTLHQFNRARGTSPALVVFNGRLLGTTNRLASAHGWQVVGGYEANQPMGWDGSPEVLSYSPSATASVDVLTTSEMAVGWYNGRVVRRLHVRLTSAPPLNTDRYVNLNPAGRASSQVRELVRARCVLNDSDVSEAAGRLELPLNIPSVGYHAWLDVPNSRFVIRRVSDTAAVGGNSWALNNTNDYDSVDFVFEYTADY